MSRGSAYALLAILVAAATNPASAFDLLDSEGRSTSGVNDTLASAEIVGAIGPGDRRRVRGWIDDSNASDVDFYRFDVSGGVSEVFLEVDFADDAFQLENLGEGLDTGLWVFDDEGRLIARNDDATFFGPGIDNEETDPGSDAFGQADAFVGGLPLADGTYYAAVSWFGHHASAESQPGLLFAALVPSGESVVAATPDWTFALRPCSNPSGFQCTGGYALDLRTTFVPEPSSTHALLVGTAFLLASVRRRSTGLNR